MRFSLRISLTCIAVFAVALASVGNMYRARQRAIRIISRHGGTIEYDEARSQSFQLGPIKRPRTVRRVQFRETPLSDEMLWALTQLSDVSEVEVVGAAVRAHDCEVLSQLPSLEHLAFFETQIEDGALRHIAMCHKLWDLNLAFSDVKDHDCEHISQCKTLKRIAIYGTDITDRGLEFIGRMPCLSIVHISKGPITEQGIETLMSRRPLKALYCFGDEFNEEWWTTMRERYPKCRIHR